MKKSIYTTLVLSILLYYGISEGCISPIRSAKDNNIQQIQSGRLEMNPSRSPQRQNKFNVSFKSGGFNISNLNLALSIIYIDGYYDKSGVDFQIRPRKIQSTFFTALFIINDKAKWVKAYAYYVASSLDDFKCQFKTIDEISILSANSKAASISVKKLFDSEADLKAYASISGIKIESTSFDIQIGSASISGKSDKILIPVTFTGNQKKFQLLSISYIVYANTGRVILSPSTIGDDSFVENVINGIISDIQIGGMTGVSSLGLNNLLNSSTRRMLTRLTSFNLAFKVQTYGSLTENVFETVMMFALLDSVPQLSLDVALKIESQICLSYDQCISSNGAITRPKNKPKTCKLCPTKKKYNQQKQRCQCKNGYLAFSSQQCIKISDYCGENTIYENGACYEKTKTPRDLCKLKENFQYDKKSEKCICKDGFFLVRAKKAGICTKCKKNQTYNSSTLSCQCNKGFVVDGTNCRNQAITIIESPILPSKVTEPAVQPITTNIRASGGSR